MKKYSHQKSPSLKNGKEIWKELEIPLSGVEVTDLWRASSCSFSVVERSCFQLKPDWCRAGRFATQSPSLVFRSVISASRLVTSTFRVLRSDSRWVTSAVRVLRSA